MNEDQAREQEQALTETVDSLLNSELMVLCPRCGEELKTMNTSNGQEVATCPRCLYFQQL